jgi:hypothetical protein
VPKIKTAPGTKFLDTVRSVLHHARCWPFFRYVILPAVSATNETDNAREDRANYDEAGAPLIEPRPTARNARRSCRYVHYPLRTELDSPRHAMTRSRGKEHQRGLAWQ